MSADDEVLAALVAGAEQHLAEVAGDEVFMLAAPILMQLDALLGRAELIAALRAAKGRGIGDTARFGLQAVHDELAHMIELLREDDPDA